MGKTAHLSNNAMTVSRRNGHLPLPGLRSEPALDLSAERQAVKKFKTISCSHNADIFPA